MEIVVLESSAISNLIEVIIQDNLEEIGDCPITPQHGWLTTATNRYVSSSVVETLFTKMMMMAFGDKSMKDQVGDLSGVKPVYFSIINRDRNLQWLKNVDWYEICVNLENQSIAIMVKQ